MNREDIKIVEPHRLISRKVTIEDKARVEEVAQAMNDWMIHKYSCVGLAHPQFDNTDPLAFFITLEEKGRIILNPKIIFGSGVMVQSHEGCMTFPDQEQIYHERHKAITVEYEVFKGNKIVKKRKVVTGTLAIVYQHEIDHLNGKYCYDDMKGVISYAVEEE